MKKLIKTAAVLTVAAAAAVFAGCGSSPQSVFKKNTGVSIAECNQVTTVDTTGWNGDGMLVYTFYLDEADGQVFENRAKSAKHWQSLPMPAAMDELIYEHFGSTVPCVENGYYFFYDEQNRSHTVSEDFIEQSYSYDFVVGLYDTDNSTAYYYEQHT